MIALAGARAASREWLNRVLHDEAYAREYYGVRWPSRRRALVKRARKLGAKVGLIDASRGKFGISQRERLALVTDHLGGAAERIVCLDHHTCHAAAAYYGSGFAGREALVLTNDNSGDGLCATASTGRGLDLARHEATPSAPGSIGAFYSFVTLLLGMKFGEHEYKVMGLAPYAPEREARRAERVLRELFDVEDGQSGALLLAGAGRALPAPPARHPWAPLRLDRRRRPAPPRGHAPPMDRAHARALRRRAPRPRRRRLHEREGQHAPRRGGVGGGPLRLPLVRRRVQRRRRRVSRLSRGMPPAAASPPSPAPFGPAYLGPSVTDADGEAAIRERRLEERYAVSYHDRIEARIADLLVSDGVVARCAGRMEFGARALGNRSILAEPQRTTGWCRSSTA